MEFRNLVYAGQTKKWFSEIINSGENLLLCSSQEGAKKSTDGLQVNNKSDRYLGLYTSASTGDAKCIWNSVERLCLNAQITGREFDISNGQHLLMMVKPWHIAGLSWVLMAECMDLDYTFVTTNKGESQRWHYIIQKTKPDYLLTVPEVLRSLFKYDNWFVPKIVFGGSPIKEEDYERLSNHTSTVCQGYGQTEAGGLIICHKIDLAESTAQNLCNCYGYPPKEFQLKCKGTPADPKSIYLKSPTAIYENFYDTGDIGFIAGDGKLFVAGRAD